MFHWNVKELDDDVLERNMIIFDQRSVVKFLKQSGRSRNQSLGAAIISRSSVSSTGDSTGTPAELELPASLDKPGTTIGTKSSV